MTLNTLTLIGMPGAGKSSVGVLLAKQLGMHFIDSDLDIQVQVVSCLLWFDGFRWRASSYRAKKGRS